MFVRISKVTVGCVGGSIGRPRVLSTVKSVRAVQCQARKKPRQQDNFLVVGLVSALTESLRLLGVGQDRYEAIISAPTAPPSSSSSSSSSSLSQASPSKTAAALSSAGIGIKRLPPGDLGGVMEKVRQDFDERQYIITGILDDTIYDEDCFFADPTVSFSGLQLWKRNLQLLVPFLIQPSVKLSQLQQTGIDEDGRQTLRSEWSLDTYLSLPWKPYISILGATDYTLNAEGNVVVEHVESWNVSGLEAIGQILRPGNPPAIKDTTSK